MTTGRSTCGSDVRERVGDGRGQPLEHVRGGSPARHWAHEGDEIGVPLAERNHDQIAPRGLDDHLRGPVEVQLGGRFLSAVGCHRRHGCDRHHRDRSSDHPSNRKTLVVPDDDRRDLARFRHRVRDQFPEPYVRRDKTSGIEASHPEDRAHCGLPGSRMTLLGSTFTRTILQNHTCAARSNTSEIVSTTSWAASPLGVLTKSPYSSTRWDASSATRPATSTDAARRASTVRSTSRGTTAAAPDRTSFRIASSTTRTPTAMAEFPAWRRNCSVNLGQPFAQG